jgi:hypothetical protein
MSDTQIEHAINGTHNVHDEEPYGDVEEPCDEWIDTLIRHLPPNCDLTSIDTLIDSLESDSFEDIIKDVCSHCLVNVNVNTKHNVSFHLKVDISKYGSYLYWTIKTNLLDVIDHPFKEVFTLQQLYQLRGIVVENSMISSALDLLAMDDQLLTTHIGTCDPTEYRTKVIKMLVNFSDIYT